MSPGSRQPRSVRQRILQAAEELFLKKGVKVVKISDITQYAGVSRKTLYELFPSRESLLWAAVRRRILRIAGELHRLPQKQPTPLHELFHARKILLEHVRYQTTSPLYQLQQRYPHIARWLLRRIMRVFARYLRENIQRGQEMGLYRKQVDPDRYARLYFAMLIGSADPLVFPTQQYSPVMVSQFVLNAFVMLIATREGRRLWRYLIARESVSRK